MLRRIITRRQIALVFVDFICIFFALWLAPFLYIYVWGAKVVQTGYVLNPWWEATILVQLYLLYLVDFYETEDEQSSALIGCRVAIAVGVMVMILVAAYFFARHLRQSRAVILFYGPTAFVTTVGARLFINQVWPVPQHTRKVMLVCNGRPGPNDVVLAKAATDHTHRLASIIVHNGREEGMPEDVPVRRISSSSELAPLVVKEHVDELVVGAGCEEAPALVRELIRLSYQGVLLSDPVTFFERVTGKLPCEYLTDASFLSFHLEKPKILFSKVKRLSDVTAALLGIVLLSPICAVVAALIKLTSTGPVFFRQERVGLDGEPFILMKFRTMVENAEALSGPIWAAEDDPRITRVGRILRKTRFDEFPQLINVLKGEMSLIGPRPERAVFVEQFEREIPYYRERLAVRPGVTGWAQVNQGYAAGTEETKEKLSYDLFYLKNQSLMLDLMIAFMTAKKMLRGGGR